MGSFIRSFMDWKGKDCMFLGLEGFLALDWTGLDWTGPDWKDSLSYFVIVSLCITNHISHEVYITANGMLTQLSNSISILRFL